MTQTNYNSYLTDMAEHLAMAIKPAHRRQLIAECLCGWQTPLCKKPDAASRLWAQMHIKPMQAELDAARCNNCHRPWAGDLCPECQKFAAVFAIKRPQ